MTDKITMIELFSGIGAQERAMRQLGIPYEVTHTCDCDKDAVLSYAAMRNDFANKLYYYEFPSQAQMIAELQAKNVGYDFQKSKHTITSRTPIHKLKEYYLADKLSKNLGDISKVERLPYADLVTYSYPCTDLSVAGKGEGMVNKCNRCGHTWPINFEKPEFNNVCFNCGNIDINSTRSGLLGQVQRLLTVSYKEHTLPKYLLLENVKNLVGKKFKPQFDAWVNWLDLIGYNTYYQILNAKHYGIPQNRERIFAVSIRKDVDNGMFTFSEKIPLTTRLKDVLEKDVDEKYYLPDERIEKILNSTFMQEKKRIQMTDVCDTLLARDWKDPKCVPIVYDDYNSRISSDQDTVNTLTGNCGASAERNGVKIIEPIVCEERRDEGIRLFKDDCVGTLRTIDSCGDKRVLEPKTTEPPSVKWKIRKLTTCESWRLMGFSDGDHNKAAKYVSHSALYKQAGNSICTCCLIGIFNSLFNGDHSGQYKQYLVNFES